MSCLCSFGSFGQKMVVWRVCVVSDREWIELGEFYQFLCWVSGREGEVGVGWCCLDLLLGVKKEDSCLVVWFCCWICAC